MASKLKIIGKYLGCAILTVIVAFMSVGVPLMVVSATDLEIPVAASADDCGGWSLGADTWTNNSQYSSIGKWTTKTRGSVAYRFQLNIPAGATITSAYFSGVIQTTGTGVANIFVEDDDNAAQISSGADQAARDRSALSVEWTLTGLSQNTRYSSPELKTLIQYLVNLGTWTSGNYCNVIIEDSDNDFTSWVNFYMYDNGSTYMPKLYVTYTEEATTTTTTTTTTTATTIVEPTGDATVDGETKWEYLNTGNDSDLEIYGDIWAAQTFTVGSESHSTTKIKLLMYREGTPSTITVGIREVSSGLPTRDDITSGTINGSAITATSTGLWYSIILDTEGLEQNKVYAIVVRAPLGNADNSLHILFDSSSAYTNGGLYVSYDTGNSWGEETDADALFEVYGKTLIQISGVEIYKNYIEDGDWLIAVEYINEYLPYYPSLSAREYFTVQLFDTDNATVLASRNLNEFGNKPIGIYLSANQVLNLTWQSKYYIKIVCTTGLAKYYQLTVNDWKGADLTALDNFCLRIAYNMEDYYDLTFITYNKYGTVLNSSATYIFYNNIKGITKVRPNLFDEYIATPDIVTTTTVAVDAYADIDYKTELGEQFGSVADTWGTVLGIDGKAAIGIGFMIIYLIIAVILSVNGSFMWALGLSAPFLAVAAWLGVIPIMIPIAIAAVFAVIIAYKVWIQGAG